MPTSDEFMIAHDHPSLPGHFPGRPIVPGVVVLDRVIAAIEAAHGGMGALRLPQAKFLQPLLPGETARIDIEPIVVDAAATDVPSRWKFRVLRGDVAIASGEVQAA